MNFNSVDYRYTAKNGLLTLTGSDGILHFNYTLTGNTLTLSIGGQSALYTRTDTKPAQNNNLAQPNSNTTIDASMVGKWCVSSTYTNYQQGGGSSHSECVVLKPDGTYEYSSEGSISGYSHDQSIYGFGNSAGNDRGTWKVQGNTLIATSQITNQTKQYQFSKRNNKNGDPMLVIDGKEFVTYYQKSSW
ncbi:MAG: hypothetical protein H6606_01415 [Flavobacteriales bacterium]|nr:hypothetical protein [Flavobacteriales bacterium]